MKIRSTINGGVAEVSDSYAAVLIKSGQWKSADSVPAPAVAAAVRKPRTKKAPVEEPQNEE